MKKKTITLLGVGNILLQDEGFGVRVIETMTRNFLFPEQVQVLDGGTLGIELMRFLEDTTQLILVDAIGGGKAPGTFYFFDTSQVEAYFKDKVSAHELGIQDMLAIFSLLERPIPEIVVIGVEPASLDIGLELSSLAARQVQPAIDRILLQLTEWGVEVKPIGTSNTQRDCFSS